MSNNNTNRLPGLDALRAWAAIAIIMFHEVWAGHAEIPDWLIFVKWNFGLGVPLFFVVSAFSLSCGYANRVEMVSDVNRFYLRRFFRIAPLFYAVLFYQLLYNYAHGYDISFSSVWMSALFLFNLSPSLVDGIVPASWSIGVEMLFYLLFPVILIVCRRPFVLVVAWIASIGVSLGFNVDVKDIPAMQGWASHGLLSNLPYFMAGLVAYRVYEFIKENERSVSVYGSAITWFSIAMIVALYPGNSTSFYMYFWAKGLRPIWDALWGIPFGLLAVGVSLNCSKIISNRLTNYLGKISFSLYLVHPTIVWYFGVLGFYGWVYARVIDKGVAFGLCTIVSIAVVSVVASVTYRYIEVPGMEAGRRGLGNTVRAARGWCMQMVRQGA